MKTVGGVLPHPDEAKSERNRLECIEGLHAREDISISFSIIRRRQNEGAAFFCHFCLLYNIWSKPVEERVHYKVCDWNLKLIGSFLHKPKSFKYLIYYVFYNKNQIRQKNIS